MKSLHLVCLLFIVVSCQKNVSTNDTVDTPPTTTTPSSTDKSPSPEHSTKFGSSVAGNLTGNECVSLIKSLNVEYVRMTMTMNEWTGTSSLYENYTSNGIKVVLNVNYASLTSVASFPTDTNSYRETFSSIIDKYQPELIAVENEEINPHYHIGPMSDYLNMLKVALNVCHAKGIKVTNGGIYGSQLEVLTYRYLQTKSQKRADSFANNCMVTSQVKAAQNPGVDPDLEKKVQQLDTLLNFYPNLDYVNVHLYEVYNPYVTDPSTVTTATPVVVADIQEYLQARTGRPVITNETTPRDNINPLLVTSILSQYAQLNFPYVIWYSNDGEAGGSPLFNLNTGLLYPNGVAFSNFTKSY